MQIEASGGTTIDATIEVPGDKSISHRSIILGSISSGFTTVFNCLMGADVLSTIGCFRQMGVSIEVSGPDVTIHGVGRTGLEAPRRPLDAGNAGTCMRLVSGVLAGQPFESTFVGDESLSRRPMRRIIDPLQRMGAKIEATPAGTAPLRIIGRRPLTPIRYALPVASAQIKSAVLLASLYADGETIVVEPERVRDHTERMLLAFGGRVTRSGDEVTVAPTDLHGTNIRVPGDISSAAFFIVAALLSQSCSLRIEKVGLNPLRTGAITILREMGGDIAIENEHTEGGDAVGDIVIRSSQLRGITIDPALVSSAIDEFPIIFVAAAFARGTTLITGAAELRVKESDRIASMVNGLRQLGIQVEATADGAVIHGVDEAAGGVTIDTHYDHRIAMSFSIASLRCKQPLKISDAESIETSFPSFSGLSARLGLRIRPVSGPGDLYR